MINHTLLLVLVLLQFKHFAIDWCWQTPYELSFKGIYGHWGGLGHSFKHAFGSMLCLLPLLTHGPTLMLIGLVDFALHYHIDWVKVQVNQLLQAQPQHKLFWVLLGFDQLLHQLTYLCLVYLALTN